MLVLNSGHTVSDITSPHGVWFVDSECAFEEVGADLIGFPTHFGLAGGLGMFASIPASFISDLRRRTLVGLVQHLYGVFHSRHRPLGG